MLVYDICPFWAGYHLLLTPSIHLYVLDTNLVCFVSFLHLLVKTSQFLGYVVLECVGFLPFTSPNTLVSFMGLFYLPTLSGECCAFPRMGSFLSVHSLLL